MSDIHTLPESLGLHQLDTTVGILLEGYVLTMILYGFVIFQTIIYYSLYPNDTWPMKCAVAILCALDSASAAALTEALHFYLIVQFPLIYDGFDNATRTYCADNGLAVIGIFIVQLAYAHCLWKLSANRLLSCFITLVATGACALGLVMTARMSQNTAFDLFATNPSKTIISCCQALTFLAACISFCSLCVYGRPRSEASSIARVESLISRCMELFVIRGGVATFIQLGYLITFLIAPSKRYWILFQLISRRLFSVSLLTMLNSRNVVNGRGVYLEELDALARPHGNSRMAADVSASTPRGLSSVRFAANSTDIRPYTKTSFNVNAFRKSEHNVGPESYLDHDGSLVTTKVLDNKQSLYSEDTYN